MFIILLLQINESKHTTNGFVRKFSFPKFKLEQVLDLHSDNFIFTGKSGNSLTLKNYNHPMSIYKLDSDGKKLIMLPLISSPDFDIHSNYLNHSFTGKTAFISNTKGEVLRIDETLSKISYFKFDHIFFDQGIALSNNSLIVRSKEIHNHQRYRDLCKVTVPQTDSIKKFVFAQNTNELFSTDGWLHYDAQSAIIFYMYYYRGVVLCLDTNLNLLYKAKTVDTIISGRVKLAFVKSKSKNNEIIKSTVQTAPDNIVNRYCTTDNNKLYVLSEIQADNEKMGIAGIMQSIDIYSVQNGKYEYSIHLPAFHGYKLGSFWVSKGNLYALFRNFLVIYSFDERGSL